MAKNEVKYLSPVDIELKDQNTIYTDKVIVE